MPTRFFTADLLLGHKEEKKTAVRAVVVHKTFHRLRFGAVVPNSRWCKGNTAGELTIIQGKQKRKEKGVRRRMKGCCVAVIGGLEWQKCSGHVARNQTRLAFHLKGRQEYQTWLGGHLRSRLGANQSVHGGLEFTRRWVGACGKGQSHKSINTWHASGCLSTCVGRAGAGGVTRSWWDFWTETWRDSNVKS